MTNVAQVRKAEKGAEEKGEGWREGRNTSSPFSAHSVKLHGFYFRDPRINIYFFAAAAAAISLAHR